MTDYFQSISTYACVFYTQSNTFGGWTCSQSDVNCQSIVIQLSIYVPKINDHQSIHGRLSAQFLFLHTRASPPIFFSFTSTTATAICNPLMLNFKCIHLFIFVLVKYIPLYSALRVQCKVYTLFGIYAYAFVHLIRVMLRGLYYYMKKKSIESAGVENLEEWEMNAKR